MKAIMTTHVHPSFTLVPSAPNSVDSHKNTMKDTDIKTLLYAHFLCIFSVILSVLIPSFFVEDFSILDTHLTWLCFCSLFVTSINLVLYLVPKPNSSSKRSSLSHKVTRFLKCCVYFLVSCFSFHVIFVLYGAPLFELVLETFLFAVILSTFTTVPCLCLLGPNLKAWLRVFSKNGVTSIWENSLQITTISSFVGAWFGAFPIPLDWERPWQVWPISCTVGATFGYVAGLVISPLWIYWNRKQLTYKNN
ncbi:phosphatidylinositol-glycan biosynthesis class F protein isoform X2 [Fukomys damarensis]|nr:phosphatidylinositol-glycan biosynthesis class F protein isoform X2 [Fukomys damarensis]